MDKLAERENTAASRQIRSDNISMNLWSMFVPAYWCDVVIGWCMATKLQIQTIIAEERNHSLIQPQDR